MSQTSAFYNADAYTMVVPTRPYLQLFPYPEPFVQRVFSAGYDQVQRDPFNKVLFMSNKPETQRILGENKQFPQPEALVSNYVAPKGISSGILKI
jgi:hypothetical protein